MKQRPRIYYSESQKALMWECWRKGESLQHIAQLFNRNHSSVEGILAQTFGSSMAEPRLTFFDQNEWENWLTENGATSTAIWLRLAKKGAGQPTLTYEQALESALCHGWIDGQKQTESEEYWLQRFTRRSAKSIWSRLNKERAEALIAAGRMLPSGMREIEKAKEDGRWEAAYTSASNSVVPDDLQVALDANPKASAFFATLNARNRYAILFRLQNAKKPATRGRKIEAFIAMLNRGETIHP
jgi:uncharacterized protein YdeI (YjbR/CyaY-like superfamily)